MLSESRHDAVFSESLHCEVLSSLPQLFGQSSSFVWHLERVLQLRDTLCPHSPISLLLPRQRWGKNQENGSGQNSAHLAQPAAHVTAALTPGDFAKERFPKASLLPAQSDFSRQTSYLNSFQQATTPTPTHPAAATALTRLSALSAPPPNVVGSLRSCGAGEALQRPIAPKCCPPGASIAEASTCCHSRLLFHLQQSPRRPARPASRGEL